MAVRLSVHTDPACCWSWAAEPALRELAVEFGDELDVSYVMGGLAREAEPEVEDWLEASSESGMPLDPLMWKEGPLASTYPACMGVKAAQQQAADGGYRYLRALREAIMCFRRKVDTTEPLVEEARRVGLDVERFRVDLASHATVEAFAADLDATRAPPAASPRADRVPFPTLRFGADEWVFGRASYDDYAAAAERAGAVRQEGDRPGVEAALRRFGTMAAPEVQAVCGLSELAAETELWRLAADWKVRPIRVLAGRLWTLA